MEEIGLPEHLMPPMANGEVVFDAPWQGRVFGMAVSLCEANELEWASIQAALIASIARWDAAHPQGAAEYPYFTLFEEAFRQVLLDARLVGEAEVQAEVTRLAARPHDHDH